MQSVWSFQVLELARGPWDPPEGCAAIVLGHGENEKSVWNLAADYVDKALAS
jgi:hypothetical protein